MATHTHNRTQYEQLASRESNGIHVALLWNRDDNDLRVTVRDAMTSSAFELGVGGASPLDVFNHPFAYAAFQGVIGKAFTDPVAASRIAQSF